MGKRKTNKKLGEGIAKRLKELFRGMSMPKVAEKLDRTVTPVTLWEYVNGKYLPSPEVMLKISEEFNVSVDWILAGQESLFAKNTLEKDFFIWLREAEELGIAEKGVEYLKYIVEEQKRSYGTAAVDEVRSKMTELLGLDTIGKRIRHLREVELKMDQKAFAEATGVPVATVKKYEADKEMPTAAFFTAVNSKWKDVCTLDWIITGKG